MTPNEKLSVLTFILTVLRAAGKVGMAEERLLVELRRQGYEDLSEPALKKLLRDLDDKSWVVHFEQELGGTRWRITALGDAALTEQGV